MNKKTKNFQENTKKYFKDLYIKKNIIWKIISFFISFLIIVMPFFIIRDVMLKMGNQNYNFMGNFVIGEIISNTGLGLSSFDDNVIGAYTLQSIFFLFPLFIFIGSPNKYIDVGALFMFWGGFSNLTDRIAYDDFVHILNSPGINPINAVVDYWKFGDWIPNSFIFNYADVFIMIGSFTIFISIAIILFQQIKEKDENEKNKI